MVTPQGIENLKQETFGTIEEYTESFYHFFKQDTGIELAADDKASLEPLIEQAHEKGIPTMRLVEIIKEGLS